MKFAYSVIATALLSIGVPVSAADSIYVDANMVRKAQRVLTQQGFRTGVDGMMGPRTQAAIRGFQKARDLEPTGQLNRQTLVALGLQPSASAGSTDPEPQYSAQTIRSAQETLNHRGYKAGPPNGQLTQQTRNAIRAFQKSENLEDTGRLNPGTLGALGVLTGEPATSSDLVRRVQQALNSRGFHPGLVDGKLGDETRTALRAFQKAENLEATGLPNRRTLAALGIDEPLAARR
jgi:peptidoglycan hydrolase-like protein with peptidoglycan-binding domain